MRRSIGRLRRRLERLYADFLEEHIAEVAQHLRLAGGAVPPEKLVEYARAAGDRAFELFAWSDAARSYEAALQAMGASHRFSEADRAELHYKAGLACYRDLDAGPSLDHLQRAVEGFRAVGDSRRLADALFHEARHRLTQSAGSYGQLIDIGALDRALELLSDSDLELKGEALSMISQAHWMAREPAKAEEIAQQALAIGRSINRHRLCTGAGLASGLACIQSMRDQGSFGQLAREP